VSKKRTRSSIIDKKKRKKRAAIMLDNSITIKAARYVSTTYSKYIRSNFMQGKDIAES
jgi:hypothetical protein